MGLIKLILQNVIRYLSEELEYCANNYATTTTQTQVVVANNSCQEEISYSQSTSSVNQTNPHVIEEEEEEEETDHHHHHHHHDSPQNNYIMFPPDLAQALALEEEEEETNHHHHHDSPRNNYIMSPPDLTLALALEEEEEEEEETDHHRHHHDHDSPQNNYIMSPPDLALALEEIIATIITNNISGKIKKQGQRQRQRQRRSRGDNNNNNVDVVINDLKRIKHYNNQHKILLVGEGDFSFSACLALAFGRAPNIIATSLNSKEFLEKNYEKAASNIENLRMRGGKVMHGINATKIAKHASLGHIKFDRIIFNFPFAGFFTNLSYESVLRRHRRLVSLFLKNAKEMLSDDGEIHISHKTNGSHSEWNVESMASSHGLSLIQAVKFKQRDYPGYNTKYGFGGDKNFNCNPSKTYKFGLKIKH